MNFPGHIAAPEGLTDISVACDWVRSNQEMIEALLAETGAVLFRGFPVENAVDFDAFSGAFNYPDFTYQESLSNAVRINLTDRVFTANEAPPEVSIDLHHEMAQTPRSPAKLFFFCQTPAETGGATPLCRSDLLFAEFKRGEPAWAARFATLGVTYTNRMPAENDADSGQGRSWRSTLSVDHRSEAEAKLRSLGYTWEWGPDDELIATTPPLPAVKQLSNGATSFYNQLIAAYLGWAGVREDPSRSLHFGDGSDIPSEVLSSIAAMAEAFTVDVDWQAHDIALVDNAMVMHGRRAYGGSRRRQVFVALAAAS